MNISKTLSQGHFERIGKSYAFRFQYTHTKITGFDSLGRQITIPCEKSQVVYGCTKKECKEKATRYLKDEKHDEHLQIKTAKKYKSVAPVRAYRIHG